MSKITMISSDDYKNYIGGTTPSNIERLEYLAIKELRSIMIDNVPTEDMLIYEDFKKAIMEQIHYFDTNSDLITSSGTGSYTLGSYSEGGTNEKKSSDSIERISPMAYNILVEIGLLYSGLGGC